MNELMEMGVGGGGGGWWWRWRWWWWWRWRWRWRLGVTVRSGGYNIVEAHGNSSHPSNGDKANWSRGDFFCFFVPRVRLVWRARDGAGGPGWRFRLGSGWITSSPARGAWQTRPRSQTNNGLPVDGRRMFPSNYRWWSRRCTYHVVVMCSFLCLS